MITPLYKARRGDRVVDSLTGEIRARGFDPDAGQHTVGGGQQVHGTKFCLWFARDQRPHSRMVLGFDHDTGNEAKHSIGILDRIAPELPGAQAVIYDGAFRGKHIQHVMRDRGLVTISPVQAKSGGRASGQPREERERYIEVVKVRRPTGVTEDARIYTRAGRPGIVVPTETGDPVYFPLERLKLSRHQNADGTWRWYQEYEVRPEAGGGHVRLRLDKTDDDRKRGDFNRTENLRAIPPADRDYVALYGRRADAEASNRALEDTLWLNRAHSVGWRRQLLDLLGFALVVNSVAVGRHRRAPESYRDEAA